ncbi:hypothetical protein E1B28_005105 [Marasmius oreades]|uniref:Uncharacterized protein n=1 Tax=Marasmius oreades TaxID=181124 RepID=A0A9P7V031_9AGAR|nr:uncharacterized protein E1B28_005105 [Marasmius oreades]KAG7097786.1 hypothetical protein E1B28_005105 [Marasmius oreades]
MDESVVSDIESSLSSYSAEDELAGPICRLHSYFVNVQWVLGDQEKRESAADARKKRAHRRRKKLQRVKANETKRKQKDHVAVINISGDENYQQETVINDSNRRNRGVEGGKEVIELTDDEDQEIEIMEISDDEEVENR